MTRLRMWLARMLVGDGYCIVTADSLAQTIQAMYALGWAEGQALRVPNLTELPHARQKETRH